MIEKAEKTNNDTKTGLEDISAPGGWGAILKHLLFTIYFSALADHVLAGFPRKRGGVDFFRLNSSIVDQIVPNFFCKPFYVTRLLKSFEEFLKRYKKFQAQS